VNDHDVRHARLRYAAAATLAALVAAGAIAGTVALAADSPAKKDHARVVHSSTTKTPPARLPDKTHAPHPAVNQQPYFDAVQQLVDNGTITATEGQTVDSEIRAGRVDTGTLASSGFTQTQVQAVQHALTNAKIALAPVQNRPSK
jgi:hypothetical protein